MARSSPHQVPLAITRPRPRITVAVCMILVDHVDSNFWGLTQRPTPDSQSYLPVRKCSAAVTGSSNL
eukprot:361318-Chlamydomonas_euryale.AAC.4